MKPDDEYKLFFDYTDNLMERRKSVTTTYLTVNTAITAAMVFLIRDAQLWQLSERASVLFLLLFGVAASALWFTLIRQHSTSIGWWYSQLRALESDMGESIGMLTKEYNELYSKAQGRPKLGLTKFELALSALFGAIYLIFAVAVLLGPSLAFA